MKPPEKPKHLVSDPSFGWYAGLAIVIYLLVAISAAENKTFQRWLSPTPVVVPRPTVEAIGSVQRVLYVGGIHTFTQIDTDKQTILLPHVVRVVLKSELEIRRHPSKPTVVCVVGTEQCGTLYE